MIHQRIKDRVKWFRELYFEILNEVKDPDIARAIFKRVLFEEQ